MQEGRRQEAEGRRIESLYSKVFNFFQLDTYFRHTALVCHLDWDCAIENRNLNHNYIVGAGLFILRVGVDVMSVKPAPTKIINSPTGLFILRVGVDVKSVKSALQK